MYKAFGLQFQSDFELPELVPVDGEPDVTICAGKLDGIFPDDIDVEQTYEAQPDAVWLYYEDTGTILVRNGNEIIIDLKENVPPEVMRLRLLGHAFSIMLHQRGYLVLHSSSVIINGHAISFVGESGEGKSTTAAYLNKCGYTHLSDDLLAIDLTDPKNPIVQPGFPQIKLWEEAATTMGDQVEDLPQIYPEFPKYSHATNLNFATSPVPLKYIYVLDRGEEFGLETMRPQAAFVELVKHSFVAKLLEETETMSQHFEQCTLVTQAIPVRRFTRKIDLNQLSKLAELIEADNS